MLDPEDYLRQVLQRVHELLPWNLASVRARLDQRDTIPRQRTCRQARLRDGNPLPSNRTFRATGIIANLGKGGALEHAQTMAACESPRTTTLYDRTQDRLTQDEVERLRLSHSAYGLQVAPRARRRWPG